MSSVNRPPSDPPGQRGPRRPGRTIDLSASEVASEPAAPDVDPPMFSEPSAETLPAAPAPQVSVEEMPIVAGPSSGAAQSAETPAASPMEPDLSGSEPPPPLDTGHVGSVSPNAGKPHGLPWRLIGLGAAAVVVAGIVFVMVGRSPQPERAPRLRSSRLAQVERQIAELTSRPVTASVDPKIVDDLTQRLARVEAAVASPRATSADPALSNRIGTLEGDLKALSEKIDVVARRNDEIATTAGDARSRADAAAAAVTALPKTVPAPAPPPSPPAVPRSEVEALANRVTALEQAAKALQAELAKRAAADAGDRTVRLAVSAAILQSTVERGDPFAKELAAAKALAGDAKALASLEPFAASGVPSAAALSRELTALLPAMRQAAGAVSQDETLLQRLQANAEKLVRVRPLDAPGDDTAAVLARIDRRAAQSDLTGALAELRKLPPAARPPAQAWITKAEASNAAIEASRKFAADALAALGQPTP
jgi:hypothetical protein